MNQIETVRTYWSEIGTIGRLPDRSAIEPERLGRAIAWTFVLECHGGEPVFRIAGTGICELFGLDVRDLPFLRMWGPTDAETVDSILANAITTGTAAEIMCDTTSVRGRRGRLELACCPLKQAAGRIGFLGAMRHAPALPVGLDRIDGLSLSADRHSNGPDVIRFELAALANRRRNAGARVATARTVGTRAPGQTVIGFPARTNR